MGIPLGWDRSKNPLPCHPLIHNSNQSATLETLHFKLNKVNRMKRPYSCLQALSFSLALQALQLECRTRQLCESSVCPSYPPGDTAEKHRHRLVRLPNNTARQQQSAFIMEMQQNRHKNAKKGIKNCCVFKYLHFKNYSIQELYKGR